MSTAGASPRRSLPNQTFGCHQQCYPYQPTVSFSDGDGIKHAVSTNPEHETQSLLISNNATLCENNTSSFFNPAGKQLPIHRYAVTSLYLILRLPFNISPSTTLITIPELLETCLPSPINTLDTPPMP